MHNKAFPSHQTGVIHSILRVPTAFGNSNMPNQGNVFNYGDFFLPPGLLYELILYIFVFHLNI